MRMRTSITASPSSARTGRTGLTLVELLVAMTILVILTLAVSQIVSQAQRVVTIGHTSMRNNGKIGALKSIVRDDLRRVTPAGFLYLDSDTGTPGFLAFTTAGPSDTMTPVTSRNSSGSIVTYGLRTYLDKNNSPADAKVLKRVNVLMNDGNNTGGVLPNTDFGLLTANSDASPFVLANFQGNFFKTASVTSADVVDALVGREIGNTPDAGRIREKFYPGTPMNLLQEHLTLTDIHDDSWKVMTPHVTGLEFFWTDGTVDNQHNLNWYGGKDGARKSDRRNDVDANPSDPMLRVESGGRFDGVDADSIFKPYKARWTNETDPNLWPKAVKIVITIQDNAMSTHEFTYEIICPVGP